MITMSSRAAAHGAGGNHAPVVQAITLTAESAATPFGTLTAPIFNSIGAITLTSQSTAGSAAATFAGGTSAATSSLEGFNAATMINVAAFGAVGDGKTDSSAAIQRAEQEANAAHKALYFGTGTYVLDHELIVHSGDTLIAAGSNTTLEAAGTNATVLGTGFLASDNINAPAPVVGLSINGLTFAGNQSLSDPGSAGPLLVAWRATGLQITNCTFKNTPRVGALLSDVDHSGFTNCTFVNVGYTQAHDPDASNDSFAQGIAFCADGANVSAGNFVSQSTFSQIGLDAISATSQVGMQITNNKMSDLNTLAASFWLTKADGSAGLYLADDSGLLASGNSISGASGNGMDIVNSSNLQIVNNNITNSGGSGIILGADTNVDIIGNTIDNNNQMSNHFFFQAGITISDNMWGSAGPSSQNIDISGNVITDTQAAKTQNWAVQVNMEASPGNVNINTNNQFSGNATPSGIGTNGIAQAWVQPWNSVVQTVSNTAGGRVWTPTITTTNPVTVSIDHTSPSSTAGEITNSDTLTGSGDPLMTLVLEESGKIVGTTTVDATGHWSLALSIPDGLHTIVAAESGIPATIGSASVTFTLDTTAPVVTAALSSTTPQINADHFINTQTLVGSGDPNAMVTLTEGTVILGTTIADASGNWSFALTPGFGDNNIVATETDLAGNVGTASVSVPGDAWVLSGGGNLLTTSTDSGAFTISNAESAAIGPAPSATNAATVPIDTSSVLDFATNSPMRSGVTFIRHSGAVHENITPFSTIPGSSTNSELAVGALSRVDTNDLNAIAPIDSPLLPSAAGDFLQSDQSASGSAALSSVNGGLGFGEMHGASAWYGDAFVAHN